MGKLHGREGAQALEQFPRETAAIDDYLARVRTVASGMKRHDLARVAPPRAAWLSDRLLAAPAQRFLEMTARRQRLMPSFFSNR